MIRTIVGQSADEVWVEAVIALQDENLAPRRPSRMGMTRDLGQVALCISDPRQRWVFSRRPSINPAFAIAEAVWIIAGRRDSRFVNYFNRSLPRYAGRDELYHGAYGYRLRHGQELDQLQRAYSALTNNPHSRQVVLQIWDSFMDLPDDDGSPRAQDIPCNVVAMLKIENGALSWTQVMRSNDVFRGLPYNLIQFTILQEVMAGWLNARVGDFHLFADSLHTYESDILDLQRAQEPNRDGVAGESLALSKEESDKAIAHMVSSIESIISDSTNGDDLVQLASASNMPPAYQNLLTVLVAEGLRRRCDGRANWVIEALCSNQCLQVLWKNWRFRNIKAAF